MRFEDPNDLYNLMEVNEIQVLYRRPKTKPVKTVKRNQNLMLRDTIISVVKVSFYVVVK